MATTQIFFLLKVVEGVRLDKVGKAFISSDIFETLCFQLFCVQHFISVRKAGNDDDTCSLVHLALGRQKQEDSCKLYIANSKPANK